MPPKRVKKAEKKVVKRVANVLATKLARKVRARPTGKVIVTGNGDYVPNRFMRVKGRGGYFSDLGSGLGGLFGSAGGKVGGTVGGIVDAGKSIFDLITGSGDYRARARAANMTHAANGGVTNLGSLNMGAMNVEFGNTGPPRVRHREFIGTVLGSEAFATTVYRIQPGLRGASVLFPWGSSVANCFEQYRLCGMILEYKTRSTNYSASVELGTVMMSTVYDAEASPLASQIAIDNHEFTTADTPDKTFIHPIECASEESPTTIRYVQASNSSGGTDDERFNDVGIFQISTIGMPASASGAVVGELWASYDIEFLKPALPDIHAGTAFLMASSTFSSGSSVFQGGVSAAYFYDQQSSYPVTALSGTTLQLPVGYAGTYLATWSYTLNGTVSGTAFAFPRPLSWGSDITPVLAFPDTVGDNFSSGAFAAYPGGTTGDTPLNFRDFTNSLTGSGATGSFIFSTIGESLVNNTITFSGNNWGTGSSSSEATYGLIITAVDSDLPSGQYGPAGVAPAAFVDKRKQRRLLRDGVAKLSKLADTNTAMSARLLALEQLLKERLGDGSVGSGSVSTSADRTIIRLPDIRDARALSDGDCVEVLRDTDLSASLISAQDSLRNATPNDIATALKRLARVA